MRGADAFVCWPDLVVAAGLCAWYSGPQCAASAHSSVGASAQRLESLRTVSVLVLPAFGCVWDVCCGHDAWWRGAISRARIDPPDAAAVATDISI